MLVQILVTTQGKVYVRIFGLRRIFFYEQVEEGRLEPCLPPLPGNIALAQVDQRTF